MHCYIETKKYAIVGCTWYIARMATGPLILVACYLATWLPQLWLGGGVHFTTPVSLDRLCDLSWLVVECSVTNNIMRVLSQGVTRLYSSHSCSFGISAALRGRLWELEAPWCRNKPSGWGPLDQASVIHQDCEWGVIHHLAWSTGRRMQVHEFAPAYNLQMLTFSLCANFSLLIMESCKDFFFFHIAINISPICYEFSRLWKAGFGNAFPILNRPRRDKLLEYNHLNRGDYLHVFCGVRLALASMILQVTEWGEVPRTPVSHAWG